jgi:cytochrome c-type biogenesis protein CcmF
MKPGQTVSLSGYDLTFNDLLSRTGPNYRELLAQFTVKSGAETIGILEPSKRTFPARNSATTEAALLTRGVSQLYVSLGDVGTDGAIAVRLYYKPLVLLIWLGPVIMVLGGALSLSDRRLRVGAPRRSKKSALQPAE